MGKGWVFIIMWYIVSEWIVEVGVWEGSVVVESVREE